MLGMPKPDEQLSPEEQQAAQQQAAQAQQEAQQQQAIMGQMAAAELADKKASVELKQAQAEKTRTEADMTREGGEDALKMLTEQVAHLTQLLDARHKAAQESHDNPQDKQP